jgi:type IX secretion system PorP/SprF family membrane protein
MKKLLLFILLLCVFEINFSTAQQAPLMSHYMFNGLLINPAYAGSKEYTSATMLYRRQWVGIDGAPVTASASIHGLLKKKKLGLGLLFQQDKIGITKQTDVYTTFAYHLPIGNGKLSFGLQGGLSNFSSEVVKLNYWDPNDIVFDFNTYNNLLPNMGFGLYYYQTKFYAGVSVPYILSYDPSQAVSIEPDKLVYKQSQRLLATAGMVFETENDLKFKPSFLAKYEPGSKMQIDLNLNVLINDIFWVGASYRSNDAVVAIFEYQLTKKLRFGYSYDYTISDLSNYTSGSHEIMLGYDFGYTIMKMKSPRYF